MAYVTGETGHGAHLAEHAVLVPDAIAPARQVQGGHGINEAGSQPAKSAIAQGSILLLVLQLLQTVAQILTQQHRLSDSSDTQACTNHK